MQYSEALPSIKSLLTKAHRNNKSEAIKIERRSFNFKFSYSIYGNVIRKRHSLDQALTINALFYRLFTNSATLNISKKFSAIKFKFCVKIISVPNTNKKLTTKT